MGSNNEVFPGASLSTKPQDLKFHGEITTCEIGDNNSIRENVTISRGTFSKGTTKVGNNNLLMESMHIAHDCVVGNNCIIGNSTKFAGEVIIDDCAIISGSVLVHQFTRIGGFVMVQGGSRTSRDIPPYCIAGKEPIRYCGLNLVGLRRRGFSNGSAGDCLYGTALLIVYGIVYGGNIILNGTGTPPHTNDWYGFARWGIFPAGACIFLGLTVLAYGSARLLAYIQKKRWGKKV